MGGLCSKPAADGQPVKAEVVKAEAVSKTDVVKEEVAKAVETATDAVKDTVKGADALAKADEPAAAEGKTAAEGEAVVAENATPAVTAATEEAAPASDTVAVAATTTAPAKPLKVFLIFYSTYGHILKLAETYKEALEKEEGVEVAIYQVPEILSPEVLEKMHAPPKSAHPVIDPHTLDQADAFVFGFPTRFGMMASQMKSFFDATGVLWQKGALHGKPASMFTSTASQGGGQETTIMTAVTQLAHHGMIFVPAGYAAGGVMFGVDEAKGGSPWGAGTLAGADGSRQPSEAELEAAQVQAKNFATIAKKLAA
ncbi:hypothetical protein HYH03_007771 [Edaphochlamys debaryana]|uniref:NAD(P)H dehydrogenase (quinone) n=1 Tax=Edaphochlamys debaryana TaxID=47281 RepID=A0A835Y1D9_9CHLO|nr:hypothetical protein HYH03_007771 [Edaphochlamys debaryana]|eukprot:KAG2494133.1 hypothetical protein HYH03_007771 [Edaphochlamys debaryana]